MATRGVEIAVRANELQKGDVFINNASSGSPGWTPTYQESDRVEWVSEVRGIHVTVKVWRKGEPVEFELVYLAWPLVRRTEQYEPSPEEQADVDYDERHDPGNRTGWEGH